MRLLFQVLLLSCCCVGVLHANIIVTLISLFKDAFNANKNVGGVGSPKDFDYTTSYNLSYVITKLAIAFLHSANYVFNNNSGVVVSEKETSLNDPDILSKILKNKPLVLVTHGWFDNVFSIWCQNVLNAWVHKNTGTICAVDWSYLAAYEYSIAATKWVYDVAEVISNWLTVTTARIGITNDEVVLIGHSLGGQICGMVGKHQKGTISKMFCLDPAGPLFCSPTPVHKDKRLDKTDAKYVQVIMTSAGLAGCLDVCGHQTFYPNGGVAPQPGCKPPVRENGLAAEPFLCSHLQACQLFWWSLFPENDFTANECSNCPSLRAKLSKGDKTDQMGWYHKKTSGAFYLTTGSKPPSGIPSAPSTPN